MSTVSACPGARGLGLWWMWLVGVLLCLLGSSGARAQDFLPVDQAFKLEASVSPDGELWLDFLPAPGTYLYRERMSVQVEGRAAGQLSLPPGERKHDETFGKEMEVYHAPVLARWRADPAPAAGQSIRVAVGYQGCADAGLCYPPQTRWFELRHGDAGRWSVAPTQAGPSGQAGQAASDPRPPAGQGVEPQADGPQDEVREALASGHWGRVALVFFVAGVLLAFTPCVLPMVPILSSIIVGQKDAVGRGRGFVLALSYSQGMALVYTALGVAAGLLGQGLAAYLQHPWVLLGFAALMVLLALSMFGLYELQLPARWQGWLGEGSRKLPGGRFLSVFAMGVVSALIVSPCVSAPLAAALLYISQSGDWVLGGAALYAMAWGMSVPLLLVGVSAGGLLPRSGPWMRWVKGLMGVLMLGMALWIARPAWPYIQAQLGGPARATHSSALPFEPVRNLAELEQALARARAAGQPVMLDFYADWCVACIEMEQRTFKDPQVQAALQGVLLLQADVTAHHADDRALLSRFQLFGPPGIVFFDAQGRELLGARVVGYQAPAAFIPSLARAGLKPPPGR